MNSDSKNYPFISKLFHRLIAAHEYYNVFNVAEIIFNQSVIYLFCQRLK